MPLSITMMKFFGSSTAVPNAMLRPMKPIQRMTKRPAAIPSPSPPRRDTRASVRGFNSTPSRRRRPRRRHAYPASRRREGTRSRPRGQRDDRLFATCVARDGSFEGTSRARRRVQLARVALRELEVLQGAADRLDEALLALPLGQHGLAEREDVEAVGELLGHQPGRPLLVCGRLERPDLLDERTADGDARWIDLRDRRVPGQAQLLDLLPHVVAGRRELPGV